MCGATERTITNANKAVGKGTRMATESSQTAGRFTPDPGYLAELVDRTLVRLLQMTPIALLALLFVDPVRTNSEVLVIAATFGAVIWAIFDTAD